MAIPSRPVQVWNINTYTVVHEFPEQNHWVRALVVHGKSLFSGSYKTVKVRGCGAMRGRGIDLGAAVRAELHSHSTLPDLESGFLRVSA